MTRPASTRRRFLASVVAGATAGLAGCTDGLATVSSTGGRTSPAPTASQVDGDVTVGLETVATVSGAPLALAVPPSGGYPRYVAERGGVVRVLDANGLRGGRFLDLGDRVLTGGERGLLGLALHPSFDTNRRLFLRYSAPRRGGTPADFDHTFVLAEFRASRDGFDVVQGSERTLLEIPEPSPNHNAGDIAFGPDGYLYVPVGDGGGGDDAGPGHAPDWYPGRPGGNGQNVSANLLGSVLRIDVDENVDVEAGGGARPYGVPSDNPLVGRAGLDEQFAWGFRNPWRMGFSDGELYVGDVGQDDYEEVNLVVRGGNYGWNVMEGRHCAAADACPPDAPPDVRGGEPLREPVVEYPNRKQSDVPVSGQSVVCGYRYRGSALPGLDGRFVFADWVARGRLFVATPRYDGRWPVSVLEVAAADRGKLQSAYAVERDAAGELYVLSIGDGGAGGVHRVVPGG